MSYRRVNHYQSVQPDGGQQLPRGKKHTAEQIIGKLREAEIAISKGGTTKEAAKAIGVTDQTFFRWRKEYRGLRPEQAKQLKALEKESSPLKRLLADAELDKAILKEAASGNF